MNRQPLSINPRRIFMANTTVRLYIRSAAGYCTPPKKLIDRAQTAGTEGQPLPNPTGAQPDSLRENPHFTGTSADRLPTRITMRRQPTESVQLIAGQQ